MILPQDNNKKMSEIDSDGSSSEFEDISTSENDSIEETEDEELPEIEDGVASSENDSIEETEDEELPEIEDGVASSENDDEETENQELSEHDGASEDDSDNIETKDSKINHNPGWADAMAKILKTNKPKRKKTIVLAKAKKLKPISQDDDKDASFEVDGEENEEKPKIKSESKEKTKEQIKLEIEKRIRRQIIEAKGRLKPTVLDKEREKVLSKVATKGVVQLFNAVKQQQKNLEVNIQKVGPSYNKQEKVLKSVDKRAFLDVLMGAKSQMVPQVKEEPEPSNEWSVLRSDFMMGTKLKDWDKEDDVSKIQCE